MSHVVCRRKVGGDRAAHGARANLLFALRGAWLVVAWLLAEQVVQSTVRANWLLWKTICKVMGSAIWWRRVRRALSVPGYKLELCELQCCGPGNSIYLSAIEGSAGYAVKGADSTSLNSTAVSNRNLFTLG